MSQIYFTADLHFGHDLVSETRGFTTPTSHDFHIMSKLLQLPKGSTLWVLGDLDRGSERPYSLALLGLLKDHLSLHLIAGNHDGCHPMHRRSNTRQKFYLEVFDSVQTYAKVKYNKQEILLSHFPYAGDHTGQDRFNQWRLRNYGMPLIHGHTHQSSPTLDRFPNQVCVSWDAWDRPALLTDLTPLLELELPQ